MRIGLSTPQDFLALLVRRRWWVIGPFVAMSLAMAVVIKVLPKTYESESLILVRPRDVPDQFVVDLIAGSTEDRLRAIQQTVLSRTNVIAILTEFGDQMPELHRLNMDGKVERLRRQIDISFQTQEATGRQFGRQQTITAFTITYQNQRPELAQKIAAKLTSLFIEQDNKVRESQVYGTTEFFSSELDKVQSQLKEAAEQVKEVKAARQYELPEQLINNNAALDRLQREQAANADILDRNETTRNNLEQQLAQTPKTVMRVLPVVPVARPAAAPQPQTQDALIAEWRTAKTEYDNLSGTLRPNHPDLNISRVKLSSIERRMPPEVLAAAKAPLAAPVVAEETPTAQPGTVTEPNPAYITFQGQLANAVTEGEIQRKEKDRIKNEIELYKRRIASTPQVEMQLSDVLRQTSDLQKQYDDLKGKLAQAQLSENLESKQKGAQFVILDAANYPLAPSKPNKIGLLASGCLVGLAIAILIAIMVDVLRQRIWSQSEVEKFWGAPVLIEIPEILTDADLAAIRRRRMVFAASSVVASLVYGVGLYALYVERSFVLQHLDPVLQKLVYK